MNLNDYHPISTEDDWLTWARPRPMLCFLGEKASPRKLRLFAVACCRRIWEYLPDEVNRTAVLIAERFADGLANNEERLDALRRINATRPNDDSDFVVIHTLEPDARDKGPAAANANYADAFDAAKYASRHCLHAVLPQPLSWDDNCDEIEAPHAVAQCELLQDIFGNPFRPVTSDPAWLTSTVVSLSQAIYQERAFDCMPILADALEDAGCTIAEILEHCRQPGVHVRGCWLVDLLLCKE